MKNNNYDKILTRLVFILTKLSNNDLPTIDYLAEEFNVTIRTIQRDVYERLINFPIEKNNLGQLKFIDGFSLNNTEYNDNELLLIYLGMLQVKDLSQNFKLKIDDLFSKLVKPNYNAPYHIKAKEFEKIDFKSQKIKSLESSIKEFKIIKLKIFSNETVKIVKPLKIISIDQLWYLLCKDLETSIIKLYLISDIDYVITTDEKFVITSDLNKIINNVHSSFFVNENIFKVKTKVNSNIAYFFKSKKIISTQNILEEKENGDLIIEFEVSHFEDIDNTIKAWIPDIKVLEPKEYALKLENELREYLS